VSNVGFLLSVILGLLCWLEEIKGEFMVVIFSFVGNLGLRRKLFQVGNLLDEVDVFEWIFR
jgi:hypothetical protein